jgi:hypothetical protein
VTGARRAGIAAILAAMRIARPIRAQVVRDTAPAVRTEWRVDASVARRTAAQAGAGLIVPVGIYVRVAADLGGGVVAGGARPAGASGRVDLIGRLLLDPLDEHHWGPYLAAGTGYRADAGDRGRLVLVALLGVEGPRAGHVVPAIEAGFAGGLRVGVVLRRAQVSGWR